jgi:flavin-dependent dehydrogenase
VHLCGREWRVPTRQYSIRRYEFDRWLLERSGAPVRLHHVREIRRERGSYVIDGMFRCRYIVGAGGTSCPVYRTFFRETCPRPHDTQITAIESEFRAGSCNGECQLWFSEDGLPGYSWFVPKGEGYVNIGIGAKTAVMKERGQSLHAHWEKLVGKLRGMSLLPEGPIQEAGYVYYLRHSVSAVRIENAFVTGDAAGLATKDMGEGIGPAVESGIRAARAILEHTGFSVRGIPRYSAPDLLFPWRP